MKEPEAIRRYEKFFGNNPLARVVDQAKVLRQELLSGHLGEKATNKKLKQLNQEWPARFLSVKATGQAEAFCDANEYALTGNLRNSKKNELVSVELTGDEDCRSYGFEVVSRTMFDDDGEAIAYQSLEHRLQYINDSEEIDIVGSLDGCHLELAQPSGAMLIEQARYFAPADTRRIRNIVAHVPNAERALMDLRHELFLPDDKILEGMSREDADEMLSMYLRERVPFDRQLPYIARFDGIDIRWTKNHSEIIPYNEVTDEILVDLHDIRVRTVYDNENILGSRVELGVSATPEDEETYKMAYVPLERLYSIESSRSIIEKKMAKRALKRSR